MSDTQQATSREDQLAADLRAALQGRDWRIESVLTFTHGLALQVYAKPTGARAFKKVGPLLIRSEDQTIGDMLLMLAAMADGKASR